MIAAEEIAYRAGRKACADAQRAAANPHHPDELEHDAWARGWREELATLPEVLRRVREDKEMS